VPTRSGDRLAMKAIILAHQSNDVARFGGRPPVQADTHAGAERRAAERPYSNRSTRVQAHPPRMSVTTAYGDDDAGGSTTA